MSAQLRPDAEERQDERGRTGASERPGDRDDGPYALANRVEHEQSRATGLGRGAVVRSRRLRTHGHAIRSLPVRSPPRSLEARTVSGREEAGSQAKRVSNQSCLTRRYQNFTNFFTRFCGTKTPARTTPESARKTRPKAGNGPQARFGPPKRAITADDIRQMKVIGRGFLW